MRLTMFGTGNAAVTELYNTCFTIYDENTEKREYFMVDAGGGNRILKILKELDISLGNVHHLFVTHEHIDHVLGVMWLIRMIGQKWVRSGNYEGNFHIYCHAQLAEKIRTMAEMTIGKKIFAGGRIEIHAVEDGETREILGCPVTFFDIASTKAKQFGFTMTMKNGKKLTCLGDEPYNPIDARYVEGSDWLMCEAFCMYSEIGRFNPYEKHHSTVREACELAEQMKVSNLVLYHTEETHRTERKKLYTEEGRQFFHGNLFVPDDLETIDLN